MILGFAGRNKYGKKEELQARAVELVKIRSTPLQAKIRELYKASQESQAAEMMGPNGQPINPYSGMAYNNLPQLMGLGNYGNIQQQSLQGRNPYVTGAGYPHAMQGHPGMYNNYQMAAARTTSMPLQPHVKLTPLPFYDKHFELLKPVTLMAQGGTRFQEAQFAWTFTPPQATNIASNRDIQMGSKLDYLYQVQLRFFPYTQDSTELSDEFPPSVVVHVNGKQVQLPNPIPTNKPGVEPKRPPKPVNITPLCKLSPILQNVVTIKWASEFNKT